MKLKFFFAMAASAFLASISQSMAAPCAPEFSIGSTTRTYIHENRMTVYGNGHNRPWGHHFRECEMAQDSWSLTFSGEFDLARGSGPITMVLSEAGTVIGEYTTTMRGNTRRLIDETGLPYVNSIWRFDTPISTRAGSIDIFAKGFRLLTCSRHFDRKTGCDSDIELSDHGHFTADGWQVGKNEPYDVAVRWNYHGMIAPVPLPAGAVLSFGALAALAGLRARRKAPQLRL